MPVHPKPLLVSNALRPPLRLILSIVIISILANYAFAGLNLDLAVKDRRDEYYIYPNASVGGLPYGRFLTKGLAQKEDCARLHELGIRKGYFMEGMRYTPDFGIERFYTPREEHRRLPGRNTYIHIYI